MKNSRDKFLRMIAVFKFLKGAMLVGVFLTALHLIHKDVGDLIEHWSKELRVAPGNRFVEAAIEKASNLSPQKIRNFGLVSLLYAALFFTEGIGLWMMKRWAEWLTIIITSTLLQVEIYEIYKHVTAGKIVVFLVNLGIVGYLIYQLRHEDSAAKGKQT